ncbi:MAG: bifunctional precorrin-2 dehydrogenase/sirohydrochlorin ferrochelatase [Deltaproteobacteria bacterium]
MANLALNINMHGRVALVVGGGHVACRKVKSLLASGACVHVVASVIEPEITELAESEAVSVRLGCYRADDLENIFLAVAATDNAEVNRQIASDAAQIGILVAVADNPELGNCTFPAMLRRGDLEIGVSTGGRSPSFAVAVRNMLAGLVDERFAEALDSMAAIREKLLTEGKASQYNNKVLREKARLKLAELTEITKERVI